MTDRFFSLTVALEKDIREDDAEHIIKAISMIKGVLEVKGNVSDFSTWTAQERVRREFGNELWKILYPETRK